jgi:hypothetical protein
MLADLFAGIIELVLMLSRRAICTLGGFCLARRDVFTPVAAKGASQVILVSLLLQRTRFSDY